MSQPGGSRQRQALRYLGLAAASLAPRRRGSPPLARPLTYGEAELLRRNEEFNRAAEQQWQTIASEPSGREHVVNKPFSTVRDTAAIFYRLSLVLDALDLWVGHTVLDFGAGSCWLSAFLNRCARRTPATHAGSRGHRGARRGVVAVHLIVIGGPRCPTFLLLGVVYSWV